MPDCSMMFCGPLVWNVKGICVVDVKKTDADFVTYGLTFPTIAIPS